jgi:plasmid stability protein
MDFLVDADLPQSTALLLSGAGHVAAHVRDLGLANETAGEIFTAVASMVGELLPPLLERPSMLPFCSHEEVTMPSYSIRDVPEEVHSVLKREAARTHRSLNALVTSILADFAAQARRRRALARTVRELTAFRKKIQKRRGLTSDSGELAAEDRRR